MHAERPAQDALFARLRRLCVGGARLANKRPPFACTAAPFVNDRLKATARHANTRPPFVFVRTASRFVHTGVWLSQTTSLCSHRRLLCSHMLASVHTCVWLTLILGGLFYSSPPRLPAQIFHPQEREAVHPRQPLPQPLRAQDPLRPNPRRPLQGCQPPPLPNHPILHNNGRQFRPQRLRAQSRAQQDAEREEGGDTRESGEGGGGEGDE